MTTIAIHQPGYIPWLPFFDKIKNSDIFVFLDDVQFEKNGWQNRNKIRTSDGTAWLTVPVHSHLDLKLNEVKIDNTQKWIDKHKKSFMMNYSKSKFFRDNWRELEAIYDKNQDTLIELNLEIISLLLKKFNIKTKTLFSSEFSITKKGSERIIDICKQLDADRYYSGHGLPGKKYLDEKEFKKNNIHFQLQEFQHPDYSQNYNSFIPNLSSLDFLFNTGRKL